MASCEDPLRCDEAASAELHEVAEDALFHEERRHPWQRMRYGLLAANDSRCVRLDLWLSTCCEARREQCYKCQLSYAANRTLTHMAYYCLAANHAPHAIDRM